MKSLKWVIIASLLGSLVACTKGCGSKALKPEEVVEAYLEVVFNMDRLSQREELLSYTTGPLKAALAQISDEGIKRGYIEKNFHLEDYSVVQTKNLTPREVEVTFALRYRNLTDSPDGTKENAPIVTTENTVAVVLENRRWLIRDVLGNKTSLEFPTGVEVKP